jgi:uncharacterized membrane protein
MNEEHSVTAQSRSVTYSGPLPPAEEFERYEKAHPGTAERILALAEKEAENRRNNNDKLINAAITMARWSQRFALVLSLAGIAVAAVGLILGHPMSAIPPLIIAFTGLVSMFLSRKGL